MNKKIWSKGKLKQGVICLGDILVRTEFPCTEISLSCLSLIMTRSHAAEPWEGTTTLLVKRDLHNVSISLLGPSCMQHHTSLSAAAFSPHEDKQEWLALISPAKPRTKAQKFHFPACLPQGLLHTPGKADLWEWILPLQLCQSWAQGREWTPGIPGTALQNLWPAGTAQKHKRGHGFVALHWCGHRKDLKPHLMLKQSLEGKEEGRKELLQNCPQLSPSALPAAARFVLNIHLVPSFPGLSDLEPPHRAGWACWDHFLTIIMWKTCRSCCVLLHPSGGQQTPNENFYFFPKGYKCGSKPQTKEQELEFTWNAENHFSELRYKYMYVLSVCCTVPSMIFISIWHN